MLRVVLSRLHDVVGGHHNGNCILGNDWVVANFIIAKQHTACSWVAVLSGCYIADHLLQSKSIGTEASAVYGAEGRLLVRAQV